MSATGLMPDLEMTPKQIHEWVKDVQGHYWEIQHREWNGRTYNMSEMNMWTAAAQIVPRQWREIIRVLAQGGEYYSIQW